MFRPNLYFMAPIQSVSGYGERSRDLLRAFIELDRFDIKVIPTEWGDTPLNALDKDKDKDILELFYTGNGPLGPQVIDVFVQVDISANFKRLGKYNIGFTAGIETTLCELPWIHGCNNMDLVVTSSKFGKEVLIGSAYFEKDQQGNTRAEHKAIVPFEVLFEGLNTEVFNGKFKSDISITSLLKPIKEDFNFLFVGHWLNGDDYQDRKNVSGLIYNFLDAFKGKPKAPGLILKTSRGSFSEIDRVDIENNIKRIKSHFKGHLLPNIYLIHGELTQEQMNTLYNHPKVKAHVSLTRGEGFGRPLLEAASTGKPIIASGWSGHLDFLDDKHSLLVAGKLENVHPSAQQPGLINTEMQWFSFDYEHAANCMIQAFEHYKRVAEHCSPTANHVRKNFSLEKMKERLAQILDTHVKIAIPLKIDNPNVIKLPKLTPVNKPQQTIKLPKLNKI